MIRALVLLIGLSLAGFSDDFDGKIFCGYQGWFRCGGDGGEVGWRHYGGAEGPTDENTGIDIWPEVAEIDRRYDTRLRKADGSTAQVFSSLDQQTVRTHFRWMREYGIDGAFLQRFGTETRDPRFRETLDTVLQNVSTAAAAEGREWSLMYDASGLKPGELGALRDDLEHLLETKRLDVSAANYGKYRGKPLLTTWGIGFGDRETDLDEWSAWIDHLHEQGFAVMLGVPYYWRTLDRDCIRDPRLHEVIAKADVVSPWAVGRFGTPDDAARLGREVVKKDLAWCQERKQGYLPVVFPGFSWHNLMKSRGTDAKFDQIPRLGGRFLWSQAVAAKNAGCRSVYVAMFDEMDEGTAIFKFDPDPPAGPPFLHEKEVPGDRYLRVCGAIGEWLRGERGAGWPDF
ncbi:glycoside hydrolase family 71/99-like protein [Haloferula sargassicola]|uniref:Xylosidase/arabinosidase n=1 Tax=Haloferula sargassicola TaxID=490096 RepID=A0ABP9USY7_9BACT